MPTVYTVLGQSNPSAASDTTLYTVPAANSAVVSTISVCNLGTASTTFRVAIRPSGNSLANLQYVAYETTVSSYDTIYLTIGATMQANSVITVRAATANVAFSAFGSEIY
jgi:hypothetical protein